MKEYKKTNESVPNDLKEKLPGAMKKPSEFISDFLKREDKGKTMSDIFNVLKQRFVTENERLRVEYAKKLIVAEDNYHELIMEPLRNEFNEEDFLKTAFLQYMLYAYQKSIYE